MSCCNLEYIPERLHTSEDRDIIDVFYVSDTLYRRASDQILENPYASVTLSDLSHNIGINNNVELSKKSDVLYSILEEKDIQVYDLNVVTLKIISLNDNNQYDKTFVCAKNEGLKVRLLLSHSPVCCMYPHCVFRFFVYNDEGNEVEVSIENSLKTLKLNKYKYLRDRLRHELSLMIIREAISYDNIT